ncbi:MAG: phosphatase PAP2 family protein [Bacteroidetes bacterium]|nr:phosphatase PAP2 family protein [Bacteroidota bacterium]
MNSILDLDKKILLWLNGFHHPALDTVMYYCTQTLFWLPLYLFLIFLIFKNYKKDGLYFMVGVAITILLADQITSSFMKPFFARLRPSHEPSLEGMVHIVRNYRGGLYGFASGHAANTFGVALLIWLALKPFYRWIGLIFLWAALMTYTRIYLGVHYPGDILVGGTIGSACGWVGFKIARWIIDKQRKTTSV